MFGLDIFGFLDTIDPVFWACLLGFFWANCPCCTQTCNDFCPDGAQSQYQITVDATTYTADADPTFACTETRCDERSGVRAVDLVPAADIQSYGVPQGSVPTEMCVWKSADFESCLSVTTPDVGDPFENLSTFRYVLQMGITSGTVFQADLYLVQVGGGGTYTADHDRWQLIENPVTSTCGDPLTLTRYDDSQAIGGGCVLDTASTVLVELPP